MTDRIEIAPLSVARGLWKRKLWLAATWVVATTAAVTVAYRLPAVYQAESVILVELQGIPEKYVSSTVNADLQDRLNRISQQILSSTQLQGIIERFDLYPEMRQMGSPEDVFHRMRGDITISVENRTKDRPAAFRIACRGSQPQVIAQVVNHISGLLIEENGRSREVQAAGTSQFLQEQLTLARTRLEEQEAKVSEYKLKYNGELPQQETALLATLGQFQSQLQGAQEAMLRAEQSKLMLEGSLASARASAETLAQVSTLAELGPGSSNPAVPAPLTRSKRLQGELQQLRTRYTPDHPDVKRVEVELARTQQLERESPAASKLAETRPADGLARLQVGQTLARERERIESLQGQLQVANNQLRDLEAERGRLLATMASQKKRMERLPIREQQLAAVLRDYEISKSSYQSLLERKLAADVASDMETQRKPERFRLLDPAQVPEKPIRPNRPLLSVLGSAGGLLLGVMVALGIQLARNPIQGEWDLPAGVWVLGRIPLIGSDFSFLEQKQASPPIPPRGSSFPWRVALLSGLLLTLGAIMAAGAYFGHLRF